MQSIPLFTGAVLLLTLGVWSTARTIPGIEHDLETRVTETLASQGMPFHRVAARGRSLEVVGVPASQVAAVGDHAHQLWGVRAVEVRDDLGDGSWVRIEVRDGAARMEGTVESPDLRDRLREAARAGFGGRPLQVDLSVDGERAEPLSWPTSFVPLFAVAGRGIEALTLTLDGQVVSVEGQTIHASAVDSLGAQLFGAAPGLEIRNLLAEATDFSTRLRAALSGPSIAFEPNTSRLSRGSRDVLARIVQAMRGGEEGIVVIGRWTQRDAGGRRLAAARVGVLLDYFAAHGVDSARIHSRVEASDGTGPVLSIIPEA